MEVTKEGAYIGITDDTDRRKAEHKRRGKNVAYWNFSPADTEAAARRVEKYFQDLGMNGDTGLNNAMTWSADAGS